MAPRASRQTPLAGGEAGAPRSRVLTPANPDPNPDTNPVPNPVEPGAHHPGTVQTGYMGDKVDREHG
jgi:hypothetical protein